MKIFRLFISSTFNDMDRERFLLHKRVFPELKALCTRYGARFNPVDLRWGVNEHAQQDFQTMSLCLREVARCQRESKRPNFLILLGDRYGWEPVPTAIEAKEFQELLVHTKAEDQELLNQAYQLDENAVPAEMIPKFGLEEWFQHESELLEILRTAAKQSNLAERDQAKYLYSATHQEIIQGLYLTNSEVSTEQTAHVMACLRTLPNLDRDETSLLYDGKDQQVSALKSVIEARLAANKGGGTHSLYHYQAKVRDAHKGEVNFDEEAFVQAILAHLTPIIEEELSEANESEEFVPPMVQELRSQSHFREERATHFTGRVTELQVIKDYIQKSEMSDDEEITRKPLAIIAKGGTGKSALMAEAIAQLDAELSTEEQKQVFFRFAGASPRSFKLLSILETLTTQLNEEVMSRHEGEPPELKVDFSEEYKAFESFNHALKLLSDVGGVVIFIDALDQLHDQASDIKRWLSSVESLPSKVSLILSALPTLAEVTTAHCSIYDLPALDLSSGASLLDIWLAESQRSLNEAQKAYLLSLYEASGEVLALKLLALRAQSWKSFSTIPELPNHSEALVDLYLKDLERAHNPSLKGKVNPFIERILGLMVSSRWGLTEDELFEIPMSDDTFFADFQGCSHHELPAQEVPAVMRSRLWFDLSPFLSAQLVQGELVYLFHHRVFNEGAQARYREPNKPQSYQWLVDYYEKLPLRVDRDQNTHLPNPRPLIELPHALFMTNQRDRLWQHLTDFDTLMAGCEAGLAELVLTDYQQAWATRSDEEYEQYVVWESFFREKSLFLLYDYPRWGTHKVLLQFAMEHADESPVTLVAEAWLKEGWCDWKWSYNKTRPKLPYVAPLLKTLVGHQERIDGVIELGNGNLLSYSWKTIRLWASNGELISVLEGHEDSINGVIELRDGKLLSYSEDNTLRLWSFDGRPLKIIKGHIDGVGNVIELKDGCILSWSKVKSWSENPDFVLKLWSSKCELLASYVGHSKHIEKVIELNNGAILSFSRDNTLRIWSREEGTISILGDKDIIGGCLELINGNILSWSRNGTMSIWSPKGEAIAVYDSDFRYISRAIQLQSGAILSWGMTDDNTHALKLLSEDTDSLVLLELHSRSIAALELSDGKILSWSDKTLSLRSSKGQIITVLDKHTDRVNGAIELDSRKIISWSDDKTLRLWSANGKELAVLNGHAKGISSVLELSDGKILSRSADKTLKLWSAKGKLLSTIQGYNAGSGRYLELRNRRLLTWSRDKTDKTIRLWSLESESHVKTFDPVTEHLGKADMVGGNRLVWSDDNNIRVCSSNGEVLATLIGHNQKILYACEFKDGKIFSCTSKENRLWSSHGEQLAILTGHNSSISLVHELKNGNFLTASVNTLLLRSSNGNIIKLLEGPKNSYHVNYTYELDNGMIFSASYGEGTLRLYKSCGEYLQCLQMPGIRGLSDLSNGRIIIWCNDNSYGGSDPCLYLCAIEEDLLVIKQSYNITVDGFFELSNGNICLSAPRVLRIWSPTGEELTICHYEANYYVQGVHQLDSHKILAWLSERGSESIRLLISFSTSGEELSRLEINEADSGNMWASFAHAGVIDRLYVGFIKYLNAGTHQQNATTFWSKQGFIQLMDGSELETNNHGLPNSPILRKNELISYLDDKVEYVKRQKNNNIYIHPSLDFSNLGLDIDNFEKLFEYENVMKQQRQTIYRYRLDILEANTNKLKEVCLDNIDDLVKNIVDIHYSHSLDAGNRQVDDLIQAIRNQFGFTLNINDLERGRELETHPISSHAREIFSKKWNELNQIEEVSFTDFARDQYLDSIDEIWKRHLKSINNLRSAIGLKKHLQADPFKEYQHESFNLFKTALLNIKSHVIRRLL